MTTHQIPDTYNGWQLDRSSTQTDPDDAQTVTYFTRVDGHRYSIYIEEDGEGFGGALIDHIEPVTNPHRSPITTFEAKTLPDAIEQAKRVMDTGVRAYLSDMETDFTDTDAYDE